MGQPKKQRKNYAGPEKRWDKNRILSEKELSDKYGYKNKKEIWRLASLLRNFRAQARKIVALDNEQARKEGKNLLEKLYNLGLLEKDSKLDDVLELTIDKISDRRLATLVVNKGIARTPKQARQFITHMHVMVGDKKVTSPNYLVSRDDEKNICFADNSVFTNKEHPLIEQMKKACKPEAPPKKKGEKEEKKEPEKLKKLVEEKPNKVEIVEVEEVAKNV